MTRKRKKRTGGGLTVYIDGPRRSEKMADPDSYESRKRKNLDQKKKTKSVYEKARAAEQSDKAASQARNTPLAEKNTSFKEGRSG